MKRDGLALARFTPTAIGRLAVATCAVALLSGCDATRRDWGSCHQEPCAGDQICNFQHRCVPRLDAGAIDGRGKTLDVGAIEVWVADVPVGVDLGLDAMVAQELDMGVDKTIVAVVDAIGDRGLDGSLVDVALSIDRAIDTWVPDAPGTCLNHADCAEPGLPFCVDGLCVACTTGDECQGGTPICSAAHACVSCAAVDAGCSGATPACEADSGRCVECESDLGCKGSPERSFCVAGACVGCAGAVADACGKRDPRKPACVAGGICMECAGNDDCTVATTPICDTATHVCKPCATDNECEGRAGGPGVCLTQPERHCATDTETLYVASPTGNCPASATGNGSATAPYCSLQVAVTAAKARSIPLLVLRGPLTGGFTGVSLSVPLTVVGKQAVITPAPAADGISITSGELRLRNITIRGRQSTSTRTGISAAASSGGAVTLHLDTCAVTDNPGGGIFLHGAAFTITNTTVIRNGPNSTGWGGILVENPPVAGPTMLSLVTISDNQQVGLACNANLAPTNPGAGVLGSGNIGGIDISSTCGVVSCVAAGLSCGAQTAP